MNYGFFFDYNNDTIRLPVNPEKFSIKMQQEHTSKEVIGIGAINLLGNIKLQEISFEAEFPCQKLAYITTKNEFKGPYFYLNKFNTYMNEKKAIRFVLTRNYDEATDLDNISMLVTIKSMNIDEEALEEGDLKISFTLSEYKPYTSKTVKIIVNNTNAKPAQKKTNTKQRETKKTTSTTYIVKKGDCLWNIAKKYYGNGSKYTKIYNANKSKIKNPSLIYPGQKLTIPA